MLQNKLLEVLGLSIDSLFFIEDPENSTITPYILDDGLNLYNVSVEVTPHGLACIKESRCDQEDKLIIGILKGPLTSFPAYHLGLGERKVLSGFKSMGYSHIVNRDSALYLQKNDSSNICDGAAIDISSLRYLLNYRFRYSGNHNLNHVLFPYSLLEDDSKEKPSWLKLNLL